MTFLFDLNEAARLTNQTKVWQDLKLSPQGAYFFDIVILSWFLSGNRSLYCCPGLWNPAPGWSIISHKLHPLHCWFHSYGDFSGFGRFCLMMELHWSGSATNRVNPSSFPATSVFKILHSGIIFCCSCKDNLNDVGCLSLIYDSAEYVLYLLSLLLPLPF